MKIKSQRDFAAGVMFLAIGVGFAIGATGYPFGASAKPGPGYFPLMLGVLLALLGAIVLFKALTVESAGGDPIGRIAFKPLILILTGVVLFGLLIPRLGLVITVPLLILISSLGGNEFHAKGVAVMAAVLTVGSWLIFVKGLGLTIPVWPPLLVG